MGQTDDKGFAAMLAEYEGEAKTSRGNRNPHMGEEVTGVVVAIGADSVFIDLGAKSEGVLDRNELVEDGELTVQVGDRVTAHVVDKRDDNIVLAIRVGRGQGAADQLQQAHEHGMAVTGKITGVNKGGVDVDVAGVRAFCPISQLSDQRVEDASGMVGQELSFKITQYEAGRNGPPNVVISRRSLLDDERRRAFEAIAGKLEIGAELPGTVTRVVDFGAFVDIGGIEGLLHVSELGFGRVGHPSDVLKAGESVQVKVVKLEAAKAGKPPRVGLSLKAMMDDPWDATTKQLQVGQKVSGKVSRLEPFGAFVALGDGVEGLVHVSELTNARRVNHPREVVSVGDEVEAVVLGVDTERRRLSLSVKGVGAAAEAENAAAFRGGHRSQSLGTLGDLLKR